MTASKVRNNKSCTNIMTASKGMAFGLQAASGIFSYFSEIMTAGLRDLGITAQTFVDDIVIIEKPDPEDFFKATKDTGSLSNLKDPAFGKEVGGKPIARESLLRIKKLEERYRSWLDDAQDENILNEISKPFNGTCAWWIYGGLIVLGETKIINMIWLGGLVSQFPFRSSLH